MNLVDFSGGPIPRLEDIAVRLNGPISPGVPDIIPGLLPRKGQVLIAGATNQGKTLLGIEICSSFITGEPLWGELLPAFKAKKILYVLGEHDAETIQSLAILTKLPIPDSILLLGPEQLSYDKWVVSGGQPNLQSLKKFDKWAEGCDLIVWDPLSSFVTGENVENDNIVMRLLIDSLSLVAHKAGAACLILSHKGKPTLNKEGEEQSRKTYAIRGASAIEDAATNIFYLEKATVSKPGKTSYDDQVYILTNRKYKGIAPPEFRLIRDPATLTHQLMGNRPIVEIKRLTTQAQLGKLMAQLHNLSREEAIRILAVLGDCSERTIRRDLGMA